MADTLTYSKIVCNKKLISLLFHAQYYVQIKCIIPVLAIDIPLLKNRKHNSNIQ